MHVSVPFQNMVSKEEDNLVKLLPDLVTQEFWVESDKTKVFSYTRALESTEKDIPILVMIHGYPQSYVN